MVIRKKKSYLSQQIRLISLKTNDLFTDEENDVYQRVLAKITMINDEEDREDADPTVKPTLVAEKRALLDDLRSLIIRHDGRPRTVRIKSVVNYAKFRDENGVVHWPEGITWDSLKLSRRVAEFVSAFTRALDLSDMDICLDKIIISWKNPDILRQIVLDGFYLPIDWGNAVEYRHYRFMTASAGQLRTDKIQCVSDEAWEKVSARMLCGLTWEEINRKGGININKLMAYIALGTSATDEWDISIDHFIVINDFEAPVTGIVDFIDNDYKMTRREATTVINHCDGIGMMLPRVSRSNFMVRGPYIKGLLTSFDYLEFCAVHGVPAVIKDAWGREHDLIKEEIWIILTKSQFKLLKYYDSWDQYKQMFKRNGCTMNATNYEEPYIPDCEISYQMLQTLEDFTDEELDEFTAPFREKIENLGKDKESMLSALRADEDSPNPYSRALKIYPELLRDGYAKESLKAIKRRWTLDGRSGKIRCENKRLYAIPDMYAACEYWFLGIQEPKGLLRNGEVASAVFYGYPKISLLRSPHLYMEWTVREVTQDPDIYHWLYTNGVYTSCHDMISKVLQFDVDGDQLNCVYNQLLIRIAERNLKKYDVVPLLYDLGKAGATDVNNLEFYKGLKRAHEFSGIGQVSNSLTKLWNKDNPDRYVAGIITFYNNLVIDAAKTGFVNSYENYPEINKRVSKATGGTSGRMPFFFQFSKNGRRDSKDTVKKPKKNYAKPTQSTMNRLCERFMHIGNINFNFADVKPFNWAMMLLDDNKEYNHEAVQLFCELDQAIVVENIEFQAEHIEFKRRSLHESRCEFLAEEIVSEMTSRFGSLDETYPSLVKYLFAGDNLNKQTHKQMFWRVYGDKACAILQENMKHYSVCPKCGMKMPPWSSTHDCPKNVSGFFECVDCGKFCRRVNSKQCRCEECQAAHRKQNQNRLHKKYYRSSKE